jgi:hypothetical protein
LDATRGKASFAKPVTGKACVRSAVAPAALADTGVDLEPRGFAVLLIYVGNVGEVSVSRCLGR